MERTVWGGLTAEEMRQQYDMRVAVPDGQSFVAACLDRSEPIRASLPGPRDVRFGPGPRQLLDIYPGGDRNAPIVLFLHGGAWRSQSKQHFAFMAPPLVEAGVTLVLAGYDLVPEVGLGTMMEQAEEAVAWVWKSAPEFGGDRHRIVVGGHSAGAQLMGMVLARDFRKWGMPRSAVSGAFLISGSYDMEPHRHHERYTDLGLTEEFVKEVSPACNPPLDPDLPVVLAVGARETPGYKRQATRFGEKLRSRGHPVRIIESPDDHHFSIVDRLGDADHHLVRELIDIARGSGRGASVHS